MSFLRRLFSGSQSQTKNSHSEPAKVPTSEARLLLLSKFIKSQSVKVLTGAHMAQERWSAALGMAPHLAVKELARTGLLVRPTLAERLEGSMSLQQLKDLCRARSLTVSGKKAELAARLVASGISDSSVPVGDSYICSPAGREAAETYKLRKSAEKRDLQLQTADLLDAHDFAGASRVVCEYEARQVFARGIGVDWSTGTVGLSEVTAIYAARKAFLRKVSASDLENVRLLAALDDLWGEEVSIFPDRNAPVPGCRFPLGIAARQLRFHHSHSPGAHTFPNSSLPIVMEYIAAEGDCPSCAARNGKRFPPKQVPELPSDDCTCEEGCRCILSPVPTDLDD
jgi:hypothetical protein